MNDLTQIEQPVAPLSLSDLIAQFAPPRFPDELGCLGGFRIQRLLNHGGMGAVFLAEDEALHRPVALKLLLPELVRIPKAKERFLREARSMAAVHHDNVVRIYQVGEANGMQFIAQELLHGETLEERLKRDGRISVSQAVEIARDMAKGLAAAHEKGLLHRDIKPSNLWLESPSGRVKILDFGLALPLQADTQLTQAGRLIGTLAYMSPEQVQQLPLDARTDLFSLGSVLYRMVTGKSPFQGADSLSLLKSLALDEPPSPQSLNAEIPYGLSDLISQLLQKDREQRIGSASEVVRKLAGIVDECSASSIAPPPESPQRRGLSNGWWGMAGGLLAAAVIIITITRPDGKETTITLQEGTQADVRAEAGSKVTVREFVTPTNSGTNANTTPPVVKLTPDFTPPPPLGTWRMGPEPPWFDGRNVATATSQVLPGLIERPSQLKGIKRWNVDTVWPRCLLNAADWSPDSKWIAVGGSDGHIRVYDANTLKLHRLLPGQSHQTGVVELSWHPDSNRLAFVTEWGWGLWNVDSGEAKFFPSGTFPSNVISICWNRTGTQLALGREFDGTRALISLVDPTGQRIKQLSRPHAASWGALAWAHDDRRLAGLLTDGKLVLWDLKTESHEIIDEAPAGSQLKHCLSWNSHGQLALAAGPEVRLFNAEHRRWHTIDLAAGDVRWLADDRRLQLANVIWDTETQTTTQRFSRSSEAKAICLSPDGNQVFLADFLLQVRDLTDDSPRARSPQLVSQPGKLCWSNDGRQLACANQSVRFFNSEGMQVESFANTPSQLVCDPLSKRWVDNFGLAYQDGREPVRFIPSNADGLNVVVWSPDGRFLTKGGINQPVEIFNREGVLIAELTRINPGYFSLGWNPVSGVLTFAEEGQPVQFCDPRQGWKWSHVSNSPATGIFNGLQLLWSPDGKLLTHPLTGQCFFATGALIPDFNQPRPLSWRPDGRAYLSADHTSMAICDANGRERAKRYSNAFLNFSPAWHPRGHLITTGSMATITAWREFDLKPHWHTVLLPNQQAATFSGAGELLAASPSGDEYLVYVIDRGEGRFEMLSPSDFQQLNLAP